ncbi:hypothetical protein KY340_01460 [Candidatus Woesearchaeota archaeon]|nr:hypothetical protein [Candidatus Woesearchaeota archaeon]
MKLKILKNKTGAISNVFELVASVLYYLILFIIFIVLFSYMAAILEYKLDSNYLYFSNEISASAYLKTPTSFDKSMTVYDLMLLSAENQTFNDITDETNKLFLPFKEKFWHVMVWELLPDSSGNSEKQKITDYYKEKAAYELLITKDNKPQQIVDLNSKQLLNIALQGTKPRWEGFEQMFVFKQIPFQSRGVQKEALFVFALGEKS